MPISREELRHAMKLAALHFDQSEEPKIREWISQVIDWFHHLDTLDKKLEKISPHFFTILHPPEELPPTQTLPKTSTLQNAPSREDDYFKTSKLTK